MLNINKWTPPPSNLFRLLAGGLAPPAWLRFSSVYQEKCDASKPLTAMSALRPETLAVVFDGLGQLFLACPMWEVPMMTICVPPLSQMVKEAIASSDITKAPIVT